MWLGTVGTDANGLVLFEPAVLRDWRPEIPEGADLFSEFTTTNAGDEVLERGLMVPVLAIDDGGYDIVVRLASEPSPVKGEIVVENGEFPLHVEKDVVLADLAVLRHWLPEVGWTHVPVAPGNYSVTVRGFRRMSPTRTEMLAAGYEFVLEPRKKLGRVTAETGRNMRVINWWDAGAEKPKRKKSPPRKK